MMEAALYSIRHDPGLHTWPPQSAESKEHLHKMEGYLAQLIQAAPDATVRGALKIAINPEKDKYFKHHMGMDSTTVFGQLETSESQELPATYRSHGSSYEARVPVFIYNAKDAPEISYFTDNYKLAAWMYR